MKGVKRDIRSFENQIAQHEKWITDPTSKVADYHSHNPRWREALIKGWKQDIKRHRDSIEILRGILKGKMDKKHDYGSILNAMVEVAKERGMQNSGSDYALACYQLLETAISEAEVWGVPLADIGLKGFDTSALLKSVAKLPDC